MAEGGLVTFACDGTITLSNTITNSMHTVLDGSGHQVTISGNEAVRVFLVASNATLTLINLSVAQGRSLAVGALPAEAGGIMNFGQLNAVACTFRENVAEGQNAIYPAVGAPASGGAIFNANGAHLNANRCLFCLNRATGRPGTDGHDGSFVAAPTSGSSGGPARGGAIYNAGNMTIEASLFASNNVAGGSGGSGGNGSLLPYGTSASQPGGRGGEGTEGNGPAIFNSGTAFLLNCTYAFNSGTGGNGGVGGSGSIGQPSGLPGSNGATSGALNLNGGLMINGLLASNTFGGNCSGSLTDAGHNLSSDGSCAFTNVGSSNNTDPKLGTLADNGGPTLTMALSLDSPALNAAESASAPPTDQRGFPRPVGVAADIGAFEVGPARLNLNPALDGGLDLVACGIGGQRFCLMTSSNLATWSAVSTNQFDSTGIWTFHTDPPLDKTAFYRLVAP